MCYNLSRRNNMNFNNGMNSASSYMQQQMDQQHRDFQQQVFQQNENFKQLTALDDLSKKLQAQNITQTEMTHAIGQLIKEQIESNKIIQQQCDELKRQNDLLQEQNINQEKELKQQKIWNWITYGITTAIAVASVIATFIGIFK